MQSQRVRTSSNYQKEWNNYQINNLAVRANQLSGFGPYDFNKYFLFLSFDTSSFNKLHYYCEDKVGVIIQKLRDESMTRQLKKERALSFAHFNLVPGVNSEMDKIPIIIKQDMQWLQRGFHSPTGTMHTIRGLSNKIISTNLLINKCTICSNYKAKKNQLKTNDNYASAK